MTTFRLPPGAKNIEMHDGRFLQGRGRNKHGKVITTDRLDDERAVRKHARDWDLITEADFTAPPKTKERNCVACGFTGWPWQDVCPRCEGEMEEKE